MDLVSGLAATGNAINLVKAIRDADAAIDTATLKSKLADVMNELADAKLAQTEMLDENRSLKAEIARLQNAEQAFDELIESDGYLYPKFEDGQPKGWPTCPTCKINDRHISIMVQDGQIQSAKCPRCDGKFSPVTCFISSGKTAVQDRNERQGLQLSEHYARMEHLNRNSWMSR